MKYWAKGFSVVTLTTFLGGVILCDAEQLFVLLNVLQYPWLLLTRCPSYPPFLLQLWQRKMSPDIASCPLGDKIVPDWKTTDLVHCTLYIPLPILLCNFQNLRDASLLQARLTFNSFHLKVRPILKSSK